MIYRVRILLARAWRVKRKTIGDRRSANVDRRWTMADRRSLQLEIADIPHVVAVPHVSVVNAGAVDDRILLRELDFFDNLAGLHVVPEEREQIRIAHPERVALRC